MKTLTVVCDSPKHARGKVSRMAVFIVSRDEGDAVVPPKNWVIDIDTDACFSEVAVARNARATRRDGLPCKLCGRVLPVSDPRVSAAVKELAERGAETITLTELAAKIASQGNC